MDKYKNIILLLDNAVMLAGRFALPLAEIVSREILKEIESFKEIEFLSTINLSQYTPPEVWALFSQTIKSKSYTILDPDQAVICENCTYYEALEKFEAYLSNIKAPHVNTARFGIVGTKNLHKYCTINLI